ncbi:MAG: type II toxin-antitoxin system HicA family toxin [Patescibacteria group bacterium]|nr:type II toxin-antitoxin system HicA family toxin [Patescibacteria group bacterium]
MKPVSGKRMCKVLEDKGWTLDRINGSHHVYESPAGVHVSVPVHANRDLRPGTQRGIMRTAGLTDQDV